MDAATRAWRDQHDAKVTADIRRHGWHITYVGGGSCGCPECEGGSSDQPPFAYTVGLFGLGHPELLIFGVGPTLAANILNGLGTEILSGAPIMPGQLLGFEEWAHRVVPEEVPNPGDIVFEANRFYRRPPDHSVPVLQLTYDDDEGRFPWDDGYASPGQQPRPGTFSA
jgi:Domain of unknown function (DUF4262)